MDIGTLDVRRLMLGLVTMCILLVLMSWYRDGSYILDLVKVFTNEKVHLIADAAAPSLIKAFILISAQDAH